MIWNAIGDANWRLAAGVVQADKGRGLQVSMISCADFRIRAGFWVDADANSGIFLRWAAIAIENLSGAGGSVAARMVAGENPGLILPNGRRL